MAADALTDATPDAAAVLRRPRRLPRPRMSIRLVATRSWAAELPWARPPPRDLSERRRPGQPRLCRQPGQWRERGRRPANRRAERRQIGLPQTAAAANDGCLQTDLASANLNYVNAAELPLPLGEGSDVAYAYEHRRAAIHLHLGAIQRLRGLANGA